MSHFIYGLALNLGKIAGGASIVTSIIGITSCWGGLKVTQLCRQKEVFLPQGNGWKTTYKVGQIAGVVLAGLSAVLTLVGAAAGGLGFGVGMSIYVGQYIPLNLKPPVQVTLIVLGLAGLYMPTVLCISKLFKHYRSSLPLPCCAG